jgi:hypothetical protein
MRDPDQRRDCCPQLLLCFKRTEDPGLRTRTNSDMLTCVNGSWPSWGWGLGLISKKGLPARKSLAFNSFAAHREFAVVSWANLFVPPPFF